MEPLRTEVGVWSVATRGACRCERCPSSLIQSGGICPEVRRHDCTVDSILTSQDGPGVLRYALRLKPGGLQFSLAECGKIVGPGIAHSLCAIARWRWIMVKMLCTRL